MTPHRPPRLERGLLLLLLLTLALPLALTAFVRFTAPGAGWVGSLRRSIRTRLPENVSPLPPLSWTELRSTRYQAETAQHFNEGFAGHDWVRRATQEATLRLFNAAQGHVVLGRRHSAFFNDAPLDFVDEYAVERPPADSLDYLLKGLRLWRDSCQSRGVGFAIVITPSKAAVYPEDLPAAWQQRHDPRPRAYDLFTHRLDQEHIHYVDGHRLALEAKAHAPAPVFPRGGVHWDQFAALQTTNALLRELASQGQPLRPIDQTRTEVSYDAIGEERDMITTIDPLIPWRYPINRVFITPVPLEEGKRPSLVLIGGSFVGPVALQLAGAQEFSEIHWLRYYHLAKQVFGWKSSFEKQPYLNVEKEVYPAQNLVLEVNEQYLTDPSHLRKFFDDTLHRLPDPRTPGQTFPYAAYLPVHWNEPLKFFDGSLPIQPGYFTGLAAPDPAGCWSDEPDTTLCLTVPDLRQDAVLSVVAGAAAAPGKTPFQRVQVFANGQFVTEWVHEGGYPQRDEALIPRAMLGDGRLVLRFHYSQPTAPSSYDPASLDHRKLALLFGTLTLRQAVRHFDGPVAPVLIAGQGDPAYLARFSRTEPYVRLTVGPGAVLRLPVPPGDGGVTLTARVGAPFFAATLPGQHIDILVNGQPVGQWRFLAPASTRREVTIPRALLHGETLRVEFRFASEPSPAGASPPTVLLVRGVQLHWSTTNPARPPSPVF